MEQPVILGTIIWVSFLITSLNSEEKFKRNHFHSSELIQVLVIFHTSQINVSLLYNIGSNYSALTLVMAKSLEISRSHI